MEIKLELYNGIPMLVFYYGSGAIYNFRLTGKKIEMLMNNLELVQEFGQAALAVKSDPEALNKYMDKHKGAFSFIDPAYRGKLSGGKFIGVSSPRTMFYARPKATKVVPKLILKNWEEMEKDIIRDGNTKKLSDGTYPTSKVSEELEPKTPETIVGEDGVTFK